MFRLLRRRRQELVCRQAVELVTDYLEGVLTEPEQARFEAHLAACPHCSAYLAQIRTVLDALGHVEPEQLEPEVQEELVVLYRRWQSE